jgi:DNA-binding MarR family transcriptional regulator
VFRLSREDPDPTAGDRATRVDAQDDRLAEAAEPSRRLGEVLRQLVDRISHRSGETLAVMSEASVTLQQVLLLNRIAEHGGNANSTQLAAALNMSLPSVSQMIDRLHQLGLAERIEMREDRRQRRIGLTPGGCDLLTRLRWARSVEYEAGVNRLSKPLRRDLEAVLARALDELAQQR